MSKYMTKQREALLEFLRSHIDESFSAKQIADALKSEQISVSAVYRNLSALEAEGKLRRVVSGNGREVNYQYSDDEGCRECLHMSCKKCGKTFHMSADGAALLIGNVAMRENFRIDKVETVLYGVCENCNIEENK